MDCGHFVFLIKAITLGYSELLQQKGGNSGLNKHLVSFSLHPLSVSTPGLGDGWLSPCHRSRFQASPVLWFQHPTGVSLSLVKARWLL